MKYLLLWGLLSIPATLAMGRFIAAGKGRRRQHVLAVAYPSTAYVYLCEKCEQANVHRTIATDPPWILPCAYCQGSARRSL